MDSLSISKLKNADMQVAPPQQMEEKSRLRQASLNELNRKQLNSMMEEADEFAFSRNIDDERLEGIAENAPQVYYRDRKKENINITQEASEHRYGKTRRRKMRTSAGIMARVKKMSSKMIEKLKTGDMGVLERISSFEKIYEENHSGARYVSEAISNTKSQELTLKNNADYVYYTRLLDMYLREINSPQASELSRKEINAIRRKIADTERRLCNYIPQGDMLMLPRNMDLAAVGNLQGRYVGNVLDKYQSSVKMYQNIKKLVNYVKTGQAMSLQDFNMLTAQRSDESFERIYNSCFKDQHNEMDFSDFYEEAKNLVRHNIPGHSLALSDTEKEHIKNIDEQGNLFSHQEELDKLNINIETFALSLPKIGTKTGEYSGEQVREMIEGLLKGDIESAMALVNYYMKELVDLKIDQRFEDPEYIKDHHDEVQHYYCVAEAFAGVCKLRDIYSDQLGESFSKLAIKKSDAVKNYFIKLKELKLNPHGSLLADMSNYVNNAYRESPNNIMKQDITFEGEKAKFQEEKAEEKRIKDLIEEEERTKVPQYKRYINREALSEIPRKWQDKFLYLHSEEGHVEMQKHFDMLEAIFNKWSGGEDVLAVPSLQEAKRIAAEGSLEERLALYIGASLLSSMWYAKNEWEDKNIEGEFGVSSEYMEVVGQVQEGLVTKVKTDADGNTEYKKNNAGEPILDKTGQPIPIRIEDDEAMGKIALFVCGYNRISKEKWIKAMDDGTNAQNLPKERKGDNVTDEMKKQRAKIDISTMNTRNGFLQENMVGSCFSLGHVSEELEKVIRMVDMYIVDAPGMAETTKILDDYTERKHSDQARLTKAEVDSLELPMRDKHLEKGYQAGLIKHSFMEGSKQ